MRRQNRRPFPTELEVRRRLDEVPSLWHGWNCVNARLLPILALTLFCARPADAQTDRFVKFPGGPKINISVPMGYSFEPTNNPDGSVGIKMENPVWGIVIYAIVANDKNPAVTRREWQQSKLIEHMSQHVARASESDYAFKPFTPLKGTGLYCAFSAFGADKGGEPPPGETTHVTGGIKAWPGAVVLFQIFSNGVTSQEYHEAFDLFSWSFTE